MRKLATIQRITKLDPIPGADRIEKATVLGWNLVVKKGEFQEGDLCVYIEIDSQLPERSEFEFMRDRKFRVKTIKLRGQISQGLALPVQSLFMKDGKLWHNIHEGEDVTDLLNITKYDLELQEENKQTRTRKTNKRSNPFHDFMCQFQWYRKLHRKLCPEGSRGWPEFIIKTDETRLQNMPQVLQQYKDYTFYATEKVDGQSATYFYVREKGLFGITRGRFGVCSRNLYLKTPHNCNWWNVAKKFDIENKLKSVGKNIAIQGEIIAPSVQGNKYGVNDYQFFVFNVWDIDKQRYYGLQEMRDFLAYDCKLNMVPAIIADTKLLSSVAEMVDNSKAKSILADTHREGLVWRTMQPMPNGMPVSFKVINPDFLLKYNL